MANQKTLEYVAGYLIGKALAMESVFIWATMFSFFAVRPEFQKRVLLYGVVGAIITRGVLIYRGEFWCSSSTGFSTCSGCSWCSPA